MSLCVLAARPGGAQTADPGALRINEVLTSNSRTAPKDANGKFQDMVEIFNSGDQPVALKDLLLSGAVTRDAEGKLHPQSPWKFTAGSVLPHSFVMIFCDGKGSSTGSAEARATFKLPQEGGLVALFAPGDVLIDLVVYPRLAPDTSYGRVPDGAESFCHMATPSFHNCSIISGGCQNAQNGPCSNIPPRVDLQGRDSIAQASDADPAAMASVLLLAEVWDEKEDGIAKASVFFRMDGGTEVELPLALDAARTSLLTQPDPLNPTTPLPDRNRSIWTAEVPGQTAGVIVTFTMRAEDREGASAADPAVACAGAPGPDCQVPYRYRVGSIYQGPLVVNEVTPLNLSIVRDPTDQKFEDYIELYSPVDVELSGLWLSSNPFRPEGWQFPAGSRIANGQHLLVWCDGDDGDTKPLTGEYHTSFKLSDAGEAIFIFDTTAAGEGLIDGFKFGATGGDIAWSRLPDGSRTSPFVAVKGGSPAAANSSPGKTFIRGDADGTQVIDLSDAVGVLQFLFNGGDAPRCPDAADSDDSGVLDLSDPITVLDYLFLGGTHPPPPFPQAGPDPTPDPLGCGS